MAISDFRQCYHANMAWEEYARQSNTHQIQTQDNLVIKIVHYGERIPKT